MHAWFSLARVPAAGCVLALTLLSVRPLPAQAPPERPAFAGEPAPGPVILRVEVNGLRYHREGEIKARLESREGRRYDRQTVSEDLQRLHQSGFFSRIQHVVEDVPGGVALVFTVVENERIAAVRIEGAKKLEAKTLQESLRLKPGGYYDEFRVRRDVESIRQAYQEKGHHFVEVVADAPLGGPDGVTLRYTVIEGPEVHVADVLFTGRVTVDRDVLLDHIAMHPKGWPGSWFSPTSFVERLLRDDVDRLKVYYRWEGWLDADVALEDVRFSPDKTEATVVFHVEERWPYRLRSLDIQGNTIFTTEELLKAVGAVSEDTSVRLLKPGGPFSEHGLKAARDAILAKYRERAYILAEVEEQRLFAANAPEVDLFLQVREHGKVYVDRIVIQGNTKTRDDVLRRALGVGPGEEYNKVALERGIRRLKDLSYFEKITYHDEPGTAPDRRNVVLDVVEGPTGALRFAGGYNSSFGVVGVIDFTQNNFDLGNPPDGLGDLFSHDAFAGGGQTFRIQFMPGTRRTGFSVSFYEPYVFGEPIGFFARGYRQVIQRLFGYVEDRRGVAFGFDRRFYDEKLTLGLGFRVENIKINQVEVDASPDAHAVEGLNLLRSVVPKVSYDTRDSRLAPTEGWEAAVSTEIAGGSLGGDFGFNKTRLDAEWHLPVWPGLPPKSRHVLSLGTSFGWAGPTIDNEVPVFERFFAGGGGGLGLRGFSFRRVGPKYFDDPIGGDALFLAEAEYGFPIYEEVIRGAYFVDAGDLEPSVPDLSMNRMRYAAGVGIRLVIPQLGGKAPIAFYYGVPLRKESGDDRRSLSFDIGFPF